LLAPAAERQRSAAKSAEVLMNRPGFWLLFVSILLVTGCADQRVTLLYQPGTGTSQISEAQPVTIFAFFDRRGDEGDKGDPLRVGGVYGGYGNRLSKVMADRPFMPTFVNAIGEGFKARGVPVTVIADGPFTPGSIAGLALSGDLKNFSTEARWTNSAHISSIVRLYGPTGDVIVEKEISERVRSDQGGAAGVLADTSDLERILNAALAKFVERVVTDPDIDQRISGAR